MNPTYNVCIVCRSIPYIRIKALTNEVHLQCSCSDIVMPFKEYIETYLSNKHLYIYSFLPLFCTNSYFHTFYSPKGFCNECIVLLCEQCRKEHTVKYPSHFILPIGIQLATQLKYNNHSIHDKKYLDYCYLFCGRHFCAKCEENIIYYEVMNVNDFKYSFDYKTKLAQFNEYQHIMNELIKNIHKEYHSEFNKPQVKKAFQRFIERYNEFITVLQIQFDTYDIFHSQGRTNYPAMINIIKNTKYLTNKNTLLNYHFKIRYKDDLINFFDRFRFINEYYTIGEPSDYRIKNIIYYEDYYQSLCYVDENYILLGTTKGIIVLFDLTGENHRKHAKIWLQGKVNKICKLASYIYIAYDDMNNVVIFKIELDNSLRRIDSFDYIHKILSIDAFNNGAFVILFDQGYIRISTSNLIRNNSSIDIDICEEITGFASFIILKDQRHLVLYGEKGYLDFYQFNSETEVIREKRFDNIFIKYNDSVFEVNNRIIIGCQVDKENTNAITIINLLMKREITIIDDYCMKVDDTTQIQPFYFYQDENKDSVFCNGPKGIIIKLSLRDNSITYIPRHFLYPTPYMISYYIKPSMIFSIFPNTKHVKIQGLYVDY